MSLPSNLYPYLVGSVIFFIFGFRGYSNYRRLHNPLSLLFGISGCLIGAAFFLWSVPFFFTTNNTAMIAVSILGDVFYYAMLVMQAYIVFYLSLKGRVSAAVMVVPALLIATIGLLSHVYGYIHNGVEIVNNAFQYELPFIASAAQILLLVNVFLVGILLLVRLKDQTSGRGRLGLISIAVLYLFSAMAGTLNILIAGEPNQSPAIIATYIGGFVLFIGILVFVRFLRSNPKEPNSNSSSTS